MKNLMEYKGYCSKIEYCSEDEIFHGKLMNIDDLVSFEGRTVEELKKDFKEAVDHYIQLCERDNKKPKKLFRGSFNIRIGAELHREAAKFSQALDISLNKFVEMAIREKVKQYEQS